MKKRSLLIILSIIFILCTSTLSFADELSNKKDELNGVKDKIEDIKDKIGDVKGEQKDVSTEIDKIDNKVKTIEKELDDINQNIKAKTDDIKRAEEDLKKAEDDYNKQDDLYAKRVRAMYMNGPASYLEILLSSRSFSEFISNADMVSRVMEYDKDILTEIKDKMDTIKETKTKLEEEKGRLTVLQNSSSKKKGELDSIVAQKESYLSKLEKDQAYYEKQLKEEENTSKQIEAEIKAIEAKLSDGGGTYTGSKTGIVRVSDIGYMPRVTSPYGWRSDPFTHVRKFHAGMDIGVPYGTPIYSMADGEVIIARYLTGYGYCVVVNHGSGISTLYAHNSTLLVREGQKVTKGQRVSKSGSTGWSTGPHLHFEVRKNGVRIDPTPYYVVGQ